MLKQGVWFLMILFHVSADQCPELPVPIRFYKGIPGQMGFQDVSNVLQSLFATIFQALKSNATNSNNTTSLLDTNITDISAFNLTGWDENLSTPSSTDQLQQTTPVGVGSTTPAPSRVNFDLGSFLSNILPGAGIGNATKKISAPTQDEQRPAKGHRNPLNLAMSLGQRDVQSSSSNDTLNKWGVSVPYNTKSIEIAKINQSSIVDTFKIDNDYLKSNKSKKNLQHFVQNVDLSDFNIEPDLFYVVCVNMLISQDNEPIDCQRCALLRPCETLGCDAGEKILAFQGPNSKVQPYDARLLFYIYASPLANTSLVTRVQTRQPDTRCPPTVTRRQFTSNQSAFEKFERADRLYPDSVLYVNVPNLSPREAYSVEGDLLLDVASASPDGKAPFGWSNPVVVGNYFGSAPIEYVIGACSRPF